MSWFALSENFVGRVVEAERATDVVEVFYGQNWKQNDCCKDVPFFIVGRIRRLF
jgi:hypothetical protein